jgi:endonuclease/exonuclease/phosphatase (EEP) superfamily protein YafD
MAPLTRMIGVAALLALLPSWLGLLGDWHWFLDLFSHFRWQYLIISASVIAWATWRRQPGMITLAALTFLLNALLIGQLAWHAESSPAAVTDDFTLRVLSLNVLTSNQDKMAVLEHVNATDADVVFLMEVDQQWLSALASLHAKYAHRILHPRTDNFGVALYSRIPFARGDLLWLGDAGLPSIEVRMKHQGRDFVLIGTHPLPPAGRHNAAARDSQLGLLAEHVSLINDPVLVVGDLNATPWSAGMRLVTAKGLGFRAFAAPWRPTWRAGSIFAIPIDHALATAPLVVSRRSVGPDVGSDHRPLDISLSWATSPQLQ